MKKTICTGFALFLTAAVLIASAVSCAGDPPAVTTNVTDAPAVTTDAVTEAPVHYDFDGRTFSVYVPNDGGQADHYIGDPEVEGNTVNEHVIERNNTVEENLHVVIRHTAQNDIDTTNFINKVAMMIMAGESEYDLYAGYQYLFAQMLEIGGYVNLYDLEDINFSNPWWWNNYMDELTLGKGTRIFAVSDYFLDTLMNTRAVFYNLDIYNDYYNESRGSLYKIVMDSEWTLDLMAELAKGVYVDLNNDGKTDEEDQLGFATYMTLSSVDAFVYGTDIEFSQRTEDGRIELNMMQDKAVTLTDKLVDFFWQQGSIHWVGGNIFAKEKTLFMGNAMLANAAYLTEMASDWGIVPYPKYDEAQKEYRSLVHDATLVGMVNSYSANLDMVGAVLEALSAESYKRVTPAWYEVTLKNRYTRDEESKQMIQLIHDSITTNFVFAYNFALNDIGMVYRTLVTYNSKDYASTVAALAPLAQSYLDALYETFMDNNKTP